MVNSLFLSYFLIFSTKDTLGAVILELINLMKMFSLISQNYIIIFIFYLTSVFTKSKPTLEVK